MQFFIQSCVVLAYFHYLSKKEGIQTRRHNILLQLDSLKYVHLHVPNEKDFMKRI